MSASDVDFVIGDNKKHHKWSRQELENETQCLLSVLENYTDNNGIDVTVKLVDFDEVLEAWSSLAAKDGMDAANRAADLLRALEANMSQLAADNNFMQWNVAWYNNVMHAYARCSGGRKAAEEAVAILDRMLKACMNHDATNGSLAPPEPTTRSFNIAINAWAKSGEEDSGQKAEEIFTRMEYWKLYCDKNRSEFNGAVPNARTLSGVIDAWAQSGASGAEERASYILMHAIDKQRASERARREGGPPVEGTVINVNVILFNSVIHAWVNSKRGQVGAERAEQLLRILERFDESGDLGEDDGSDHEHNVGLKPNTRTLSLVIDAWAQCENNADAAERAQNILNMTERLYRDGEKNVKPTYMAFTSCISAWARSVRNPNAAEKAEALLDRMLALYYDTGDNDFRPTVATGNAVISAWAKSKHAQSTQRAAKAFDRLKDFCEPDVFSYNSLINAYAKRGEGLTARRLLQEMEDACKSGRAEVCPDRVTYNTVIYALSKSSRAGSAKDAESLLRKMEAMYKEGNEALKPTPTTYTAVITAWGRSRQQKQAQNASKILRSMIDRYEQGDKDLKPDVKAFTATINTCARSNVKNAELRRDALKLAIQIFETMKKTPHYENPNSITYRALINACSNLSSDQAERFRLLRSIFQQCCQDGMVCKLVLAALKEGARRKEFVSMVGNVGSYPAEWSRNVPRRDRP